MQLLLLQALKQAAARTVVVVVVAAVAKLVQLLAAVLVLVLVLLLLLLAAVLVPVLAIAIRTRNQCQQKLKRISSQKTWTDQMGHHRQNMAFYLQTGKQRLQKSRLLTGEQKRLIHLHIS